MIFQRFSRECFRLPSRAARQHVNSVDTLATTPVAPHCPSGAVKGSRPKHAGSGSAVVPSHSDERSGVRQIKSQSAAVFPDPKTRQLGAPSVATLAPARRDQPKGDRRLRAPGKALHIRRAVPEHDSPRLLYVNDISVPFHASLSREIHDLIDNLFTIGLALHFKVF